MATPPTNQLSLVADIGGTHARFALVLSGQLRPSQVRTLQVSGFANLSDAILAYFEQINLSERERPNEVCLAIAGPTGQDTVHITNNGWSFSQRALIRDLKLQRLTVINDFTAQAYAAPLLGAEDLVKIGSGTAQPDKALAILGPGTGLGVGGLLFDGASPVPLFSEGGHVDFAPCDEREMEVLRYLWKRFDHVSAERLLCGAGLTNLYEALSAIHGKIGQTLSPAQITEAAKAGNEALCRETVEMFCAMLGSVAGNTALTLGAHGGVYIAGGIIPKILDLFMASAFRARFEAKGRFQDYLANIPTWVVTAEHPGLLGAASALQQRQSV